MTCQQENQSLLAAFARCGVSAVREGMNSAGYHHYGTLDKHIRPLFPSQAVGIARTARYLPYEGPPPNCAGEAYARWSDWYYQEICTEPWMQDIEPGDFVMLDISGTDAGLLNGGNTLSARLRGAVGFVTNGGGVRNTDEVIMQEIPTWCATTASGIEQARIRYLEKNTAICIGGVAVHPGDVVVADYDGVIVVPRAIAHQVAAYAKSVSEKSA